MTELISLFFAILAIAAGTFKLKHYKAKAVNNPERVSKNHFWLETLFKILLIPITAGLAFGSDSAIWRTHISESLHLIMTVTFFALFSILFLMALYIEFTNRNQNYSAVARARKYALQDFSFFFLAIGIFILCSASPMPLSSTETLSYGYYFVFTLQVIAAFFIGRTLGTAMLSFYEMIHTKELRKNSKAMKALRKSVKS